jgi:16S rRNA (cytidine1402-2'-O)-methyltransferase
VATPIGNIGDVSPRALEVLRDVDRVLCEDTRRTGQLLTRLGVQNRLESHHDHNERARAERCVDDVAAGRSLALVSDAGAPLISDPGFRVVRATIDRDLPVVVIPGPSAVIAALMGAGLPTDRFLFLGYLPARKGRARRALEETTGAGATLVLFEAPHRIASTLSLAREVVGDRPAAVARELTKRHEEFVRGRLSEIEAHFAATVPRGEMTLVIDTRAEDVGDQNPRFHGQAAEMYDRLLAEGDSEEEAARKTREVFG